MTAPQTNCLAVDRHCIKTDATFNASHVTETRNVVRLTATAVRACACLNSKGANHVTHCHRSRREHRMLTMTKTADDDFINRMWHQQHEQRSKLINNCARHPEFFTQLVCNWTTLLQTSVVGGSAATRAFAAAAAAATAGAAAGPAAAMSYYTTNIIATAAFVSVRCWLAIGGGASILPSSANLVINLAPHKMTSWEGARLVLREGERCRCGGPRRLRRSHAGLNGRRVIVGPSNPTQYCLNNLLSRPRFHAPWTLAGPAFRHSRAQWLHVHGLAGPIGRAVGLSRTMDDNNICQVYRRRQSVVRRWAGNSSSGTGGVKAGSQLVDQFGP